MVLSLLSGRSIPRRLPRLLSRLAAQRPRAAPFLSRTAGSRMSFHFGSSDYAACFLDLPQPDTQAIRQSALTYLKSFDAQLWYNDPIVSLLKGEKLAGDGETEVDTVNALGAVNGKQWMASASQVDQLKQHIRSYTSPYKDLRPQIRMVEKLLLTRHAGYLIGNQCIDFQKQDGVTEIEESIMANAVERRLNDLLLQEESTGNVLVNRQPIYVSAVSNFTNFLDLFRKTIRSLEVGIPVVVLGRSQTSQHSYRWTQLLVDLCADAGIDPGMITFLSCTLSDIKDITSSCQTSTGNLFTTCSRALAKDIKASYPKTVASTGGPNTLVCLDWDRKNANHTAIQEAIACSASIESAGQCTALRHCVVPKVVGDDDCLHVFDDVAELDSAESAMEKEVFSGIFAKHPATPEPPVSSGEAYRKHDKVDAFVKIRDGKLPEPGINEYWRKVVVDFSKMDLLKDEEQFDELAAWLNENQPITLAVNGPHKEAVKVGLKLWGRTGMVVNTIGSSDDPEMPPALTCQARPQEAECFGEFPPRSAMNDYTIFPVIVPSSNPSYDAKYSEEYLRERGSAPLSEYIIKSTRVLLEEIQEDKVRGYCTLLIGYLQNVCKLNPKEGFGQSRTALWGIQRPPLGMKTLIHCGPETTWDDIVPIYILFHATNARDQVELSVDPGNSALCAFVAKHKLPSTIESREEMTKRINGRTDIFHQVDLSDPPECSYSMAGNFASLYLPFGHIKSTKPDDKEFVLKARLSEKWLNTLF